MRRRTIIQRRSQLLQDLLEEQKRDSLIDQIVDENIHLDLSMDK